MRMNYIGQCLSLACMCAYAANATVIWEEDFEGVPVGTTSSGNNGLAGTDVASKNGQLLEVVNAPVGWTGNASQVVKISSVGNGYEALVPNGGAISFSAYPSNTAIQLSFDLYIPTGLSVNIGDFQPRFKEGSTGGNGLADTSGVVKDAGIHTVTYTGYISDFNGSISQADNAFPFIGFDQGASAVVDMAYVDNIRFVVGDLSIPPPLNTAYFNTLQNNWVESTPLVNWQHFGPGMSGYIDKFWINNGDPNAMYDDLDMGNGHVTLNRGEFWTSFRDIDGNANTQDGVTWIEFSHQNPDFGLMTCKSGFYESNDRGRTWQHLVDEDNSSSQKHNVMTVDPTNDDNWYVGAGQSWMIKHTHWTKSGVDLDSRNHSAGFIMYSRDRGETWTRVYTPFPADSQFHRIIVNPGNPSEVFAASQYGVYKSTNSGSSWAKVPGVGLPHNEPRDMAFYYDDQTQEFILYIVEITRYDLVGSEIVTSGGVYRSFDKGDNWENLTGDLGIDFSQITYFGTGWNYHNRFYRAVAHWNETTSTDISNNYNLPTNTFSHFHTIAVDPENKDRIYLCHNYKHDYAFPPGNIWQTDNGGTNWYASAREGDYWATETDKTYWESRAVQPLGINTELAHVDIEHNGAGHNHITSGPRFLVVNQDREVYTAFAQQVMRSTDHGVTWNQIDDDETAKGSGHWVGRGNSNLPGETFCLNTGTPGSYLWGSGEHGLWKNMDDGDAVYPGAIAVKQLTGQSLSDGSALSISTIATDLNNPNHVYMIPFRQNRKGELLFSDNGGDTWSTISTPIPFPYSNDVMNFRSLTIDHQDPDIIYFCVPFSEWARWSGNFISNGSSFGDKSDNFPHGIYKSIDGGLTFGLITNGLPEVRSVNRMAMDPENPQVLYAALNETHHGDPGGLYKTIDGGTNWVEMVIPSGINSVNNVKVHANGNIYIACGDFNGAIGGGYVSQDGGTSWHKLFDMPYLRYFEASAADPSVLVANVQNNSTVGQRNPGVYVSVDSGANWNKINQSHGQPDGIRKIQPDPYDPNILWMGLHGTGFFRADISALRGGTPKPLFWDWMDDTEGMFADVDGDGYDNRLEFILDSDPNDPNSNFTISFVPNLGSGNTVVFESVLQRTYSIDVSDNLISGWSLWTNGIPGTGGLIEIEDNEAATNRFYRVNVVIE